tara:strand:- start:121 stop:726 length:606 start_codon:yes stop_codon:yes gene_type:complete
MKSLISSLIILISIFTIEAQTSKKIQQIKDFQQKLNTEFADPEKSPLTAQDLKKFEGLTFFEIDTNYVINVEFVRTPSESPFAMPTTTDRTPIYVKYGEAYFKINGKPYKLNIYQSQELITNPEYLDYLFIPFTDKSNGHGSYPGGRYIDFKIPTSNHISLDFNKAYNPYCAYSGSYSCPIPPAENNLSVAIPVGVKYVKK